MFDLRIALQLRTANSGVLVADRVHDLRWSEEPRLTDKTARNIVSSRPRCNDRLLHLRLGMYPDAVLELVAESAAFYVGDVPGLEIIPNYIENDEATIRAQLAGWHSTFTPVHATFLAPAPPSDERC